MNFLKLKFSITFAIQKIRDVAQPGSAHVWGAWGRKFESCHPDKLGFNPDEMLVKRCFYGHFSFKAPQIVSKFIKSFVTNSVTPAASLHCVTELLFFLKFLKQFVNENEFKCQQFCSAFSCKKCC